jgi:superfamily II DNA/RNA helicase
MIFPNCEKLGQTIIFVRSRDMAKELHSVMEKDGYKCTCIQGGMDHGDRDRVVSEFRDGVTKILISTDVLSRGFDVSQVWALVCFLDGFGVSLARGLRPHSLTITLTTEATSGFAQPTRL